MTAAVLAAVGIPLALLPGLIAPSSGVKPSEIGASRSTSPRATAPSVPASAKRLHGEVAYKCGNLICLMRPDGTGRRTLTATFPEWDAAWSPDGRQLAFRGYYQPAHEGDYAIYVVAANGCHPTKLTAAMNGAGPSWSPSGRQIAFAVGGINIINANGTGFRHLTSDQAKSGRGRYIDDQPAWSATNRIAFVRTRTGTSHGEIYTINADGSGLAPLTHGGPGFAQPSWSPDGKSIAFVAFPKSSAPSYSGGVIEVADANGSGVHQVTPSSWWSYSPTWTGGKIVFLVIKGFRASPLGQVINASAYVVNRDGTSLRLLYPNLGDALEIAWGSAHLPRARCP